MPTEEQQLVLKRLLAAHETWFDVTEDYEFAGKAFDGYAEFHTCGQQYILTKKATLWEVNSFEYLFFKMEDHLTAELLDDYLQFMTKKAIAKVKPEKNHMSSYVTLILVVNSCDEDARKAARKARFRKNYAFGLKGWADMRVGIIDLGTQSVLTNAAGKQMKDSLCANAGIENGKKLFKRRN